jgi:outer membrane protein
MIVLVRLSKPARRAAPGPRCAPARAVIAALLLAGGCATDQRADVDTYRRISDPPGDVPMLNAGDPLSLVDALRLTAAYNEQLGVQGERYIQALADRQRAAATLLPTLDAFTDVGLQENTGERGIVQTDIGLTGQYRLLTGMSDLRRVSAADARIESARWLILDLRETLLVQTAAVYYQTLRAERLAEVLRSSVRAQTERLSDARARNEVGFARPLDVSQIESQVSRTKTQLIAAEREAGAARSALALLTNADVRLSNLTDGFDGMETGRSLDELMALALDHRQDILAARADAEAARSLVDAAIGQYAPSISINLDYFLLGAPRDPAPSLASLLSIRLPIFTAGRIEAEVRGAWSAFREAVLTYHQRLREVRRDVETAQIRLEASVRLAAELETQVRVASQAFELAEASYQAGLGTNLERVVAQDQILSAELEAVSESFVTKTLYLELLRSCGLLGSGMIGAPLPETTDEMRVAPDSPVLDRGRTGSGVPSADRGGNS